MSRTESEDIPMSIMSVGGSNESPKEERIKWTSDQDSTLASLAISYSAKNWNAIASRMNEKYPLNKKTSKQCRERWHYCLDLKINHKPWSKCEEAELIVAHMDYGNRWCDIATRFKGRHNNMIKNRFYSILRKVKNKIRINDYNSQDQLELIEIHYMTSVMVNYIKNPAPPEDFKRKRGRDFMYTLVNDIALTLLENYTRDLLAFNPLNDSLRNLLKKIIEREKNQGKTKGSSELSSSLCKLPFDVQTASFDSFMTLGRILEFCCGDKNKSFMLPEPPTFDCKLAFNLNEKSFIAQELFSTKLLNTS
jgi:hypothetical protein